MKTMMYCGSLHPRLPSTREAGANWSGARRQDTHTIGGNPRFAALVSPRFPRSRNGAETATHADLTIPSEFHGRKVLIPSRFHGRKVLSIEGHYSLLFVQIRVCRRLIAIINASDTTSDIMKPVHPISKDALADAERRCFDDLMGKIDELSGVFHCLDGDQLALPCEELSSQIQDAVTKHPVLARSVAPDPFNHHDQRSLLARLCELYWHSPPPSLAMQPAVKFLIEKNPHALIWEFICFLASSSSPIYEVAEHHCAIMPWIAERFSWVFDHPDCLEQPPHHALIRRYLDGQCDASIVRQFYEAYPQGLAQESQRGWGLPFSSSGCLPIHSLARRSNRPDVQQLLLTCLRQYPQSIDISHLEGPAPRSDPFIARVYPLLEKERLFKEDGPYLTGLSDALKEAARESTDAMVNSVATIFGEWVNERKQSYAQRLEQISEQISSVCREYEAEDEAVLSDDYVFTEQGIARTARFVREMARRRARGRLGRAKASKKATRRWQTTTVHS